MKARGANHAASLSTTSGNSAEGYGRENAMPVNTTPRKSKRSMLAALPEQPTKAKLAARNTLDYTLRDGNRKIRLHDTDILTIYPSGDFVVFTGGWNTVTTRARLNDFLPSGYRVSQSHGIAHLNGVPFRNAVSVSASISPAEIHSDVSDSENAALTRKIDSYMRAWRKHGLPPESESSGDPWIFTTQQKVSFEIMLDWIESQYVFRLMYFLALKYAGVPDTGIGLYHYWADQKGGRLEKIDYSRIRRYIRACLGLAA